MRTAAVLTLLALLSPAHATDPWAVVREERDGNKVSPVAKLRSCTEVTISVTADLENTASSTRQALTYRTYARGRSTIRAQGPASGRPGRP